MRNAAETAAGQAAAPGEIPEQARIPWGVAMAVAWGSLKRRLGRSLVTMTGVILAIAFLAYMLVTERITDALIAADLDDLNVLLQNAGVDILEAGGTDRRMVLLISLALCTCLVGIVNAMLMSVTERVREIGTMKCLGALDGFILNTYFVEAALQGGIGTLIGMLLGAAVAMLAAARSYGGYVLRFMPWTPVAQALALAFVIGSLISVAAAIAPARWAASRQPVDALRVEE